MTSDVGTGDGWEQMPACIDAHQELATRFGVEFVVQKSPVRDSSGAMVVQPADLIRTQDLREALSVARRPSKGRVTIGVNGSGPYWQSTHPELLNVAALRRVCLAAHLGEEAWEQHRNREQLARKLERLEVVANTPAIVVALEGCETYDEAVNILTEPPFSLTRGLARVELERGQFRGLTAEGRAGLKSVMASVAQEFAELPPPAELPD